MVEGKGVKGWEGWEGEGWVRGGRERKRERG